MQGKDSVGPGLPSAEGQQCRELLPFTGTSYVGFTRDKFAGLPI